MKRPASDNTLDSPHSNSHNNSHNNSNSHSNKKARTAQAGILERLTLRNFMSHAHLTLPLGPRLTFLIGHNGSGKSAILTAITICLGYKATATQRAPSLRALIRHGQQVAECELVIRNQGHDAYRHHDYGNTITIHRRITQDTSSFKLKSIDGRVVSTRRDELNAILDHFAIQADNPLMILNQDAAKQFLQSSTPAQRYALFLRGTQLQQLEDDYRLIQAHTETIQRNIQDKHQLLPVLKQELKQAQHHLKAMKQARDLDDQVQLLMKQISWSQVMDLERRHADLHASVDSKQCRVQATLDKIQHHQHPLEELRAELDQCRRLLHHEHPLDAQLNQLHHQELDLKRQVRDLTRAEVEMNGRVSDLKRLMLDLEARRDQHLHMHSDQRHQLQRRQHHLDRIQVLDREFERVDVDLKQAMQEWDQVRQQWTGSVPEMDQQVAEVQRQRHQCLADLDAKRRELQALSGGSTTTTTTSSGSGSSSNGVNLAVFGPHLAPMLAEMDVLFARGQFKGDKPIGPLGRYIKMRDTTKWSTAIDAHIHPLNLFAFIVSDPRDKEVVMGLYRKYQYGQPYEPRRHPQHPHPHHRNNNNTTTGGQIKYYDVFTYRQDPRFDCESGVPRRDDDRYCTLLDVLVFENEWVRQVLVNMYAIESTILVASRQLGEEVMRNWPEKVTACYDVDANKIGKRGRGAASFAMARRGLRISIKTLCMRDYRERVEELRNDVPILERQVVKFDEELDRIQRDKYALEGRKRDAEQCVYRLTQTQKAHVAERTQLREELDEMDMAASESGVVENLTREIERNQAGVVSLLDQLRDHVPIRMEIKLKQEALGQRRAELERDLAEHRETFSQLQERMEQVAETAEAHQKNLEHYQSRIETYRADLRNSEVELSALEVRLEQSRQKALEYCDGVRVDVPRHGPQTTKNLQMQIANMQAQLRTREQEQGSLEDAVSEVAQRQHRFDTARKDLSDLVGLHDALKKALMFRHKKYAEFKVSIATRTRLNFSFLLQHRNYRGGVVFLHDQKKLVVNVETQQHDLQSPFGTQQENESQVQLGTRRGGGSQVPAPKAKDPRGLSGGEKSFSTVCLLLALWEAMSSHIRALDEFDVFMDPVNRRISMEMMIDAARANPETQFLLITPQAMENVQGMGDVKVIRLKDPERQFRNGQQTLDSYAGWSRE